MAKRKHETDAESSDDDAPEALSFGSSKKAAKGEQEAVRQFHAAEKLKRKEKNRAVDRKLKERATVSKGKAKANDPGASHWEKATKGKGATEDASESEDASGREEGDSSRNALEDRMARAMREAAEEDSDGLDDEEGSEFSGFSGEDVGMEDGAEQGDDDDDEMSDEEEGGGFREDEEDESGEEEEDEEEEDGDEDEEMVSESEEDEDDVEPTSSFNHSTQKRNYLPDHLFKSALSNSAPRNTKITFDDEDSRTPSPPSRKRKRARRPAKDVVIGSRRIRTLAKPSEAISPAAAKGLPPPRRVKKFLKHSLNEKGDLNKAKSKGWTRRAANLGVMRRSGPAANFVRSS